MEDLGMAQALERVETRDRLLKFMDTDAYKEFIVDGFQNDEVVRVSQALIEDAMQDEIDQRLLKQKMTAGAHLGQYLLTVRQQGNGAEMQIAEARAEAQAATITEGVEPEYDNITGDLLTPPEEA